MAEHTPAPTPIRAVYGFAMYLCFRVMFGLYILWALVPNSWFEYFGITCLPQRYWVVAVPIYIIFGILIFGFVIYPSINLCMTPDIDDIKTIYDEKQHKNTEKRKIKQRNSVANKCICMNSDKCGFQNYLHNSIHFEEQFIPIAEDLHITYVSRLMYSKNKT